MATEIDLNKLSAELTAAGLWVVSRKECGGTDLEIYRGRGKSHSIVITISDDWDGVFVESDGENSISPEVWAIIARHVAPVAPVAPAPELQGRLARVVAWANARLSLDGFEPRDTPAALMFKHCVAWEALEYGDLDPVEETATAEKELT